MMCLASEAPVFGRPAPSEAITRPKRRQAKLRQKRNSVAFPEGITNYADVREVLQEETEITEMVQTKPLFPPVESPPIRDIRAIRGSIRGEPDALAPHSMFDVGRSMLGVRLRPITPSPSATFA